MNLRIWQRSLEAIEREFEDDAETLSVKRAKQYVDARVHRADVVQALPADAPGGYLMVMANDPNLYVGAGAGRPLRKLPTQAL